VPDSRNQIAHGHGMVVWLIEHTVHEFDIPQPSCRESSNDVGNVRGFREPAYAPLDLAVGAIYAMEGTADFGLNRRGRHLRPVRFQIQPLMIIRRCPAVSAHRRNSGVLLKNPVFNGGDAGDVVEGFVPSDTVEQDRENRFAVPDDTTGKISKPENLFRHDAERSPSHDNRSGRIFTDGAQHGAQIAQKEHRLPHVIVVDIPDRKRLRRASSSSADSMSQRISGEHQVRK
jgi:hypothetical protein